MPATDRTPIEYRLLNAIDSAVTRSANADRLIAAQCGTRDDLHRLWSAKLIAAAMPTVSGALDLAGHLDLGGRLNRVTVTLTDRGNQAVTQPTNRVLRDLHTHNRTSADAVMDRTGVDRSLLADMIERRLIRANYPPTGNQEVPAELLRDFAIPTGFVMVRLTALGERHLPLGGW